MFAGAGGSSEWIFWGDFMPTRPWVCVFWELALHALCCRALSVRHFAHAPTYTNRDTNTLADTHTERARCVPAVNQQRTLSPGVCLWMCVWLDSSVFAYLIQSPPAPKPNLIPNTNLLSSSLSDNDLILFMIFRPLLLDNSTGVL